MTGRYDVNLGQPADLARAGASLGLRPFRGARGTVAGHATIATAALGLGFAVICCLPGSAAVGVVPAVVMTTVIGLLIVVAWSAAVGQDAAASPLDLYSASDRAFWSTAVLNRSRPAPSTRTE